MARIANTNIPDNKKIPYSLAYIYGVGIPLGFKICQQAGINPEKRVKDLDDNELSTVRNIIDKEYRVEGDLRREISLNIKKKKDIGSYQGIRHRKGLPVRGQNTHSNARTRKGRGNPIANKKIAK